nr:hypothetical protein [Brenneria salicis]
MKRVAKKSIDDEHRQYHTPAGMQPAKILWRPVLSEIIHGPAGIPSDMGMLSGLIKPSAASNAVSIHAFSNAFIINYKN